MFVGSQVSVSWESSGCMLGWNGGLGLRGVVEIEWRVESERWQ